MVGVLPDGVSADSPDARLLFEGARPGAVTSASTGGIRRALGAPITTSQRFAECAVSDLISEQHNLFSILERMAVLYPVEARTLLRDCAVRRSQHLLSMLPPGQTEAATHRLDEAALRAALATVAPELVESRGVQTVAQFGTWAKLRADVADQLRLTCDFGGGDILEMGELRSLAHLASLASTVPVLIDRLSEDERYAAVVGELRNGRKSALPWAKSMREARDEVKRQFKTTPSEEVRRLEIATARPPTQSAASRLGDPEQDRTTRLATTAESRAPDLPTIKEICQAPMDDGEDLGTGLLADGTRWLALLRLSQLYGRSPRLERARLASCAGQGRSGSALHAPPERLGEDGLTTDGCRSIDRRWLGVPPPGVMALRHCEPCGQAFSEGRDDGPNVRASHFASCTSAHRGEARERGRLPGYDTNHTALRETLRDCAAEVLGDDFVEQEVSGRVEGSQMRPGDVTLYLPTHTVAVDVTIVYTQTPTSCSNQAKQPGRPVMKEEEAKRKKYANIQFTDACTRFMPFAVDDFGHIGDAGWALLDQLAAYGAAKNKGKDFTTGRTEQEVRNYYLCRWQQRIAHAVRSSIDRSMQRRLTLSRRQLAA